MRTAAFFPSLILSFGIAACAAPERPQAQSSGHLSAEAAPPGEVPAAVQQAPILPPPAPAPRTETFTVVVNDVPVKELLFALARDAKLNIDVLGDITGRVTLNAVDQTLPQILARIARQSGLRYEVDDRAITIAPDTPHLRTYSINYVNLAREMTGSVTVSTQIASTGAGAAGAGGGGSNNSTTEVKNASNHKFWETLQKNIQAILEQGATEASPDVIVNAEAGLLTVRATSRQHEQIQAYVDRALGSAQRQVLIEATVVEVQLDDGFQGGIDWSKLAGGDVTFNQSLIGARLASAPFFSATLDDTGGTNITSTVRFLRQFGESKVLSSPKAMMVNNQTAILKVVDNRVYFTVTVDVTSDSGVVTRTFETQVNTVPVGFVMAVTPQIDESGGITLNVRPTISRIVGRVRDPNPDLATAGVISEIPEIQVREIESMLKLQSGQIAILGGLMEDTQARNDDEVPLLGRIPIIGNLFRFRETARTKTELVIFIRPTVIRQPGFDGDLASFRADLRRYTQQAQPARNGAPAPAANEGVQAQEAARP